MIVFSFFLSLFLSPDLYFPIHFSHCLIFINIRFGLQAFETFFFIFSYTNDGKRWTLSIPVTKLIPVSVECDVPAFSFIFIYFSFFF
ncbi:uncharacterized protein BDW47DRAFT_100759 [Aspergillus candidus]|uniref:Uncharacterized protein n=1 Tax=Aspergillus candidus TaxID=41067 RepID=A0A2I2FJE7_ASPCN|nr:hypothetical protein BDW47DRAFT_100759 [Aspergillus candidus]PLB40742.1 hypothetical protein BDW47DRAFT_100759 [Aspergillus candidus]